jgi:hypothetical protein
VDATMAVHIPESWTDVEGAAAIVALMTQHNALVSAGRLQRGEALLVHAAASGGGASRRSTESVPWSGVRHHDHPLGPVGGITASSRCDPRD